MNEKFGTLFTFLFLIWLIDNTTSLVTSPYYPLSNLFKSDWIKNIEILLSITGIVFGMELRDGKIKPLTGYFIIEFILIIGISLRITDL